VTPWFAAATGFVIAASLWIYSPHPQLAFPAIAIGKVPCKSAGCGPGAEQQGAGSLTIKSGQRMTQHRNSAGPAGTGTRGRTAASGLTFGYIVHHDADGNFTLVVSVTGKRSFKNWHLAFVLPGDHIQFVIGAHWQAAGTDGGTASPLAGYAGRQSGSGNHGNQGSQGNWGGQASQSGSADGHGDAPGQYRVNFMVIASGKPAVPAGCHYDGAACTFHQLSGH